MICLRCEKECCVGCLIICDNDCGTMYCEHCEMPHYYDVDCRVMRGIHNPNCGINSKYSNDDDDCDSNDFIIDDAPV